ncbi:MAG: aminoacyl-tRNA hydrolase [Deltaproteobacteria bacterium]|nr:aminoacyl-tRNA hydrolase [Deltaproteobacteria bacterium]
MNLIAGLGNPGPRYKNSRHNIGFTVISLLSEKLGVRLLDQKFHSINTAIDYKGKKAILLCPLTYMNLSGKSIKACAEFYQIPSKDILIVHDDLDLSMGQLKIVSHSGSGGHKGVQSIIDYLGNTDFSRVKMGIGRPLFEETLENYVLSPFYEEQRDEAIRMNKFAVLACQLFILDGLESVMRQINEKKRR